MELAFRRIAIVNRGEPAMRLIHAVRELNHQHGAHLETIALFTDPDRRAMFVREADDRHALGPASFVDPKDGQRKASYLDYARLERALVETRADAVWVGWGFVAEHAEFVELCDALAITFIGPGAAVMRQLGDKIASKRLAEAAGVPVTPWSGGPVTSVEEAHAVAARLGYPIMIKATAGGGGRGIRRVLGPDDLAARLESARSEALKGFGDDTVFIESLVTGARHVEVQIIADAHGTVWAAGVRDCTVQRRNQKVIEEAPSPALGEAEDRALREAAVRLARAAGYTNAGTVECLFDPVSRDFYFMEMNTRLQVEHPVTEATTGLDLVKLQLHVASGGRLEGEAPRCMGHAIEVRLNAEDPDQGFAPAPGRIELFEVPTGPGIRVETGVAAGDVVPPDFDSMIAKIIAHGRDRGEAMGRLRRALLESNVVIRGGCSNKAFLLELLSHPDVVASAYDIGWLDRLTESRGAPHRPLADIALVRAAIDVYERELAVETARFFVSAGRGRPTVREEIGHKVELSYGGQTYALEIFGLGPSQYRVRVEGRTLEANLDRLGPFAGFLTVAGTRYRVLATVDGPIHLVEVDGMPHRISRDEGGMVRASAPALVLALAVEPGQVVEAGAPLVVLEAMKMELALHAPFAGRVKSVEVLRNQQVGPGAPLLVLERLDAQSGDPVGERVIFRSDPSHASSGSPHEQCRSLLVEMKRLLLGYDIDAGAARQLRARRAAVTGRLRPDDPELLELEDELLRILGDLLALFRSVANGEPLSPEEYLQTFLRSMEAGGDRLPKSFLVKLRAALRPYGVEELARGPELDVALVFLHKARARLDQSADQVFDVLERRLQHAAVLQPKAGPELRALLERLVEETTTSHLPLHDLARQVRYVLYERPFFDAARTAVHQAFEAGFARLVEATPEREPSARANQLAELVDCPQPIVSLLAPSFLSGGAPRRLGLEIMLRRYHRTRDLSEVVVEAGAGLDVARAETTTHGRRVHVFAVAAPVDALAAALGSLEPFVERVPMGGEATADLYLGATSEAEDIAVVVHRLGAALARAKLPRALARVSVVIGRPGDPRAARCFTFGRTELGFAEVEVLRGIHPMVAERLELWRLERFETKQLRAADDIYVFHAVARENAKDERLVAFVEIRDMTPVRDGEGRIREIPGLERLFLEAMANIRDFQARRAPHQRLPWNRVVLHVRPVVDLSMAEIRDLAARLAPAGRNLGMQEVVAHVRLPTGVEGVVEPKVVHVSNRAGTGLEVRLADPSDEPLAALSPYEQKVVRLRGLGLAYPYEILRMMTPPRDGAKATDFPPGELVEHDLDDDGRLVPVRRPPGQNRANVVIGVITNFTAKHPEGMKRVICLGDGSQDMGSLAEPECRRIIAGLDLAEAMRVPFEWFAVSSGARIAMDVGTEGLDWVARTLRRLVEFTQAGGEVNVVIPGINVGGQSYWNAEATMLMHTRGILVMTPQAAMVLTGKRALDYSGGVSAENNLGIGGVERIMGFNGQAQYAAKDVGEACQILFRYYEHAYVAAGERWPRRAPTVDPIERDVGGHPHPPMEGVELRSVGDIFSPVANPERKKAFDIRTLMRATLDADHAPLERWAGMRMAETAVVWDAHLGGIPLTVIGIESRPMTRLGFVPGDGPDVWTGGTLFPRSSKKVARAINAASGNRPVVVLANLSGFDGSPESMREWQLEYGAEIGRAVVNFRGPMVFSVISRYHGGAYVVFSCTLNEGLRVGAVEGSRASVIGGAPAAAVVFTREVKLDVLADPRIRSAQAAVAGADDDVARARARAAYARTYEEVYAEKEGEMARRFDAVHSVERALAVGSIHEIVPASRLRPWLVAAVERGIAETEARERSARG